MLEIVVEDEVGVVVGALGRQRLRAGRYLYIGSAQRALAARLERHFRRRKKKRWHIDYLTAARGVRVDGVLVWERGRAAECKIAREVGRIWSTPIVGFGASDCKCQAHLVGPVPEDWKGEIEATVGTADATIAGNDTRQR